MRSNQGTTETGYWYDVTQDDPLMAGADFLFQEVNGGGTISADDLLALVDGEELNRIVLQSTPTGSERRVAHLDGTPNASLGTAGSSLPTPHDRG